MFKQSNFLLIVILSFVFSSAHATSTFYSSQSGFLSALGSPGVVTHNFDSDAAGTVIASGDTLNGATFSYALAGGPSIQINNQFDATSPANYLGTTIGGVFVGGDSFTINFDQTLRAIGLYVISSANIFANDFTLTTNSGHSINNLATADVTLTDSLAYYIGLIEDDAGLGFNSITLSSFDANYSFNVDDITLASISPVPLPAAAWLMATGLLMLAGVGHRKGRIS